MSRTVQICAVCERCLPQVVDQCDDCGNDPRLVERYRLVEVVGKGASGVTYRADDLVAGRAVAIKEMAYRRAASLKAFELFGREAQVLRTLSHPGIPAYLDHFDAGEGKGRSLYLVQEYLEGHTLAQEARERRYTEDDVLAILEELLEILTHLHQFSPPVIHRDIKPENVMRRASDGSLVLIDFGSVRDAVRDRDMGGSTVAGTFGYMAPEQFRGVAVPATDIYGVGALAVALLTRREPHQLLRPNGSLDWESQTKVSARAREILGWMLALDVEKRVCSASAAAARISSVRNAKSRRDTHGTREKESHGRRREIDGAMDEGSKHGLLKFKGVGLGRGQTLAIGLATLGVLSFVGLRVPVLILPLLILVTVVTALRFRRRRTDRDDPPPAVETHGEVPAAGAADQATDPGSVEREASRQEVEQERA